MQQPPPPPPPPAPTRFATAPVPPALPMGAIPAVPPSAPPPIAPLAATGATLGGKKNWRQKAADEEAQKKAAREAIIVKDDNNSNNNPSEHKYDDIFISVMQLRTANSVESLALYLDSVMCEELQLRKRTPDFIVLPEHALSGLFFAHNFEEKLLPIRQVLAKYQCYGIIGSVTEGCSTRTINSSSNVHYNTAPVISRQGKLLTTYRKQRPTAQESSTPGDKSCIIDTDFGFRIAVLICFDVENKDVLQETLSYKPRIIFNPVFIPYDGNLVKPSSLPLSSSSSSSLAAIDNSYQVQQPEPTVQAKCNSWSNAAESMSVNFENLCMKEQFYLVRCDKPYQITMGSSQVIGPDRTVYIPQMDENRLSFFIPKSELIAKESSQEEEEAEEQKQKAQQFGSFAKHTVPSCYTRTVERDNTGNRLVQFQMQLKATKNYVNNINNNKLQQVQQLQANNTTIIPSTTCSAVYDDHYIVTGDSIGTCSMYRVTNRSLYCKWINSSSSKSSNNKNIVNIHCFNNKKRIITITKDGTLCCFNTDKCTVEAVTGISQLVESAAKEAETAIVSTAVVTVDSSLVKIAVLVKSKTNTSGAIKLITCNIDDLSNLTCSDLVKDENLIIQLCSIDNSSSGKVALVSSNGNIKLVQIIDNQMKQQSQIQLQLASNENTIIKVQVIQPPTIIEQLKPMSLSKEPFKPLLLVQEEAQAQAHTNMNQYCHVCEINSDDSITILHRLDMQVMAKQLPTYGAIHSVVGVSSDHCFVHATNGAVYLFKGETMLYKVQEEEETESKVTVADHLMHDGKGKIIAINNHSKQEQSQGTSQVITVNKFTSNRIASVFPLMLQ